MTTYTAKCRNNADARRLGAGQIKVPGAAKIVHTGGKNVRIESVAADTTRTWLDAAFEIDCYETAE